MLLTQFPDLGWLKRQIRENFQAQRAWDGSILPEPGWPTVMLNVHTREHHRRDIKGPLSLFLNRKGSSRIGTEKGEVLIRENAFAMTNYGENYDLLFDAEETECLNLHFGTVFLREADRALKRCEKDLLDDPGKEAPQMAELPLRSVYRTAKFDHLVEAVFRSQQAEEKEPDLADESLFALYEFILGQQNQDLRRSQSLEASRQSTREEIMRRLFRSLDYLHAHFREEIQLDELAREACLSKFHYLRCFKRAFGQSPYQLVKQLRLDQALSLLRSSKASLEEIAVRVGLENGSSLSRMVWQQTGFRPSQLREG